MICHDLSPDILEKLFRLHLSHFLIVNRVDGTPVKEIFSRSTYCKPRVSATVVVDC